MLEASARRPCTCSIPRKDKDALHATHRQPGRCLGLFRRRRLLRRPPAPCRLPHRKRHRRRHARAGGLPARRDDSAARGARLRLRGGRQPGAGRRPFPHRAPHRGPVPAHGDDLRPWRRGQRAGRAMGRGSRALGAHRARRALVRARHGRQQGPAQHQPGRPHRSARGARRAPGLQHDLAGRDGRGGRFARPARGVRAGARQAARRPLHCQRRPARERRAAHAVPGFARRRQLQPAAARPRATGAACSSTRAR